MSDQITSLLGIVGWIALGYVAQLFAVDKGRGAVLGWVLGLALGPVGVLIVLLIPRRAEAA